MRILLLWTQLSGYMRACLDSLGRLPGVDLHVVYMPSDSAAAFQECNVVPTEATNYVFTRDLDLTALHDRLLPDVLVISGWQVRPYRKVARRSKSLRVLAMDNQWFGTPRQRFGVALSRWYLQPLFDRVLLPGDRQAQFARRLGYRQDAIWHGAYSGDTLAFSTPREIRTSTPSSFLFVGRLVAEKGLDVLLDAYADYRASVRIPWNLTVCGSGPLTERVRAAENVEHLGFVQPSDLPSIFRCADAFVLPSRFEPWGVVIHEACSAGLPVVCSSICGAVPALVEDHWNGFLVEPGSVKSLSRALQRMHMLDTQQREEMGRRSVCVASRYTSERWAKALIARVAWEGESAPQGLASDRDGHSGVPQK
jgi:glycosyltransferase involved in cell wall biosynthesis